MRAASLEEARAAEAICAVVADYLVVSRTLKTPMRTLALSGARSHWVRTRPPAKVLPRAVALAPGNALAWFNPERPIEPGATGAHCGRVADKLFELDEALPERCAPKPTSHLQRSDQ